MSARVVCPHCGKAIKIRDRSLLGKKGRCPGCEKVFQLVEQLTSEESSSPSVPSPPAVPPVSKTKASPQRKPPEPEAPKTSQPSPIPPEPLPFSIEPLPSDPLPEFTFDLGETTTTPKASTKPTSRSPVKSKLSPRKRSQLPTWIGLGVAAVAMIAGGIFLSLSPAPGKQPVSTAPMVPTPSTTSPAPLTTVYSYEALTADPKLVAEFRPTHGQPISMKMLTGVNNIIIHMHPNRIWGDERDAQELKASLTEGVVHWLESRIQTLTHRPPEKIDDLLIGISALSKVELPQVSVVFRLSSPEPRSALIEEFGGEEISAPGQPTVTRQGASAFHVAGDNTIAISPASAAEELADAIAQPQECVTDGIADLLPTTDRDRSFTVLMNVDDVVTYADQLFEPAMLPAIPRIIDVFGHNAETICWSLNLGPAFHSEIRVRPKGSRSGTRQISTPVTLKEDYLAKLPKFVEQDLIDCIRKMHPAQAGTRQIIGRFPAMVEAFRQSTILHAEPKALTLTTVLPAKAAPNLALGAVLTWDESTRTNFDTSPPEIPISASNEALPKTVMERLKTEFEIEFARKPLADAFAYLGEETKVNFVIDGDALKMAGYTKNMPQTFSLGKAPGTKGIYTILTWPMQEKLCLVINDARMEALITTTAAAEAQGLKPVPVESLK